MAFLACGTSNKTCIRIFSWQTPSNFMLLWLSKCCSSVWSTLLALSHLETSFKTTLSPLRNLSPILPKLGSAIPSHCINLYWHELPELPCSVRTALFLYPACPAWCLTHKRMFSAIVILELRAANRWFFFPLGGYFTYFHNYWSHFDLKFTHWLGIEIKLI